ncbi:putative lipopolysaccharide heptosyltransferase III [Crenobacter cavernae]|uniref:Putative lipopolysaccharide heptosyltransferase III n=1 Tax=Crenobacter cavernae TaxID=2290923 RepID=A0A345Y5S1_9NEIS|nr:putative lipopolysaccharide heptosyltransferase III [Crenobacter cavernae]AXK39273.1 putative lipopolysaccharide heptosyltransferase III [Crenobacter cavernae]
MLKDAIAPQALRRVLVVKLRHHGDVLLTSPVLSVLKRHAPHAEIDALVYHDTREMISGHPALSELFTVDRGWKRLGPVGQLKAEWALLKRLKARDYDLIVHLTEHNRGAWLSRFLKPRHSVAMEGRGRFFKKSFTHRFPYLHGNRRHTVEIHLDALRRLGIQPAPGDRRLVLEPGDDAFASVAARLLAEGLAPRRFVVVHPSSRWMFKSWPAERMAEVIDHLAAEGWQVVLTAAPSDEELAMVNAIKSRLSRPVSDWSASLSLKELAALIAQARLYLGVDSVPMHIAAAMGTPTVALFGPSGDKEWGPWQVAHRIIADNGFGCRPCGRAGCGDGQLSECLTAIPSSRVIEAIDSLLKETA